jgi:hypothetical protein
MFVETARLFFVMYVKAPMILEDKATCGLRMIRPNKPVSDRIWPMASKKATPLSANMITDKITLGDFLWRRLLAFLFKIS